MESSFNPQQPPCPENYQPARPDNYLVVAILTTLCCCMPLGVVSIVYAAKVDGLYRGGLYQEAEDAAAQARKWAIISAVVGVTVQVLYLIVYAAALASTM
ncbi:MAG: CD225/dispanin family protein [Alloprevotella sp.]